LVGSFVRSFDTENVTRNVVKLEMRGRQLDTLYNSKTVAEKSVVSGINEI